MKCFSFLAAVSFLYGCHEPSSLTPVKKGLETIPSELCEATVRNYAALRDNGPAEEYANLFTKDGTFTLGPNITTGRAALAARHVEANKTALWRHNILDVEISEVGGQLIGVSRFIIYTGPHPAPSKNPREIIGDYMDTFVIENGACLISSRSAHIVFDG